MAALKFRRCNHFCLCERSLCILSRLIASEHHYFNEQKAQKYFIQYTFLIKLRFFFSVAHTSYMISSKHLLEHENTQKVCFLLLNFEYIGNLNVYNLLLSDFIMLWICVSGFVLTCQVFIDFWVGNASINHSLEVNTYLSGISEGFPSQEIVLSRL